MTREEFDQAFKKIHNDRFGLLPDHEGLDLHWYFLRELETAEGYELSRQQLEGMIELPSHPENGARN